MKDFIENMLNYLIYLFCRNSVSEKINEMINFYCNNDVFSFCIENRHSLVRIQTTVFHIKKLRNKSFLWFSDFVRIKEYYDKYIIDFHRPKPELIINKDDYGVSEEVEKMYRRSYAPDRLDVYL